MESDLLKVTEGHEKLGAIRSFAFDLDGTIYLQGTPLPGAMNLAEEHLERTASQFENALRVARMYCHLDLTTNPERDVTPVVVA